MSKPLLKGILESIKKLTNRVLKLETKVLLWEGSAKKGDTINLSEDISKFKELHLVTGDENVSWEGVSTGSIVGMGNDIMLNKTYINSGGMIQLHATALKKVNNKQLLVVNCAYKTLTDSSGNNSILAANQNVLLKRIYGTY